MAQRHFNFIVQFREKSIGRAHLSCVFLMHTKTEFYSFCCQTILRHNRNVHFEPFRENQKLQLKCFGFRVCTIRCQRKRLRLCWFRNFDSVFDIVVDIWRIFQFIRKHSKNKLWIFGMKKWQKYLIEETAVTNLANVQSFYRIYF